MTTTTTYGAAFAAVQQRNERLLQSADALDCALQGKQLAPASWNRDATAFFCPTDQSASTCE